MSVREVVIMEQILLGVPAEMAVWLKEKKPESLDLLGRLADDYALARKSEGAKPARLPAPGLKPEAYRPPNPMREERQRAGMGSGRVQVNAKGDKRCYSCGHWGHLSYSCPNKKALFAGACQDVAWNEDSYKYLRRGTVDGRPVQMLVDTGCDRTIVSATIVKTAKLDPGSKVPVLCVHGDTCFYPTATVKLASGPWSKEATVAVAPNLPVAVLLGRDIYEQAAILGQDGPARGLAVVTRSKAKAGDGEENEREEVMSNLPYFSAEELEGVEADGVSETHEDDKELRGKADSGDNGEEKGVLNATPEQIQEWQEADETLENIRKLIEVESMKDSESGTKFARKAGLLYRIWKPKGVKKGGAQECEQLVLPAPCRSVVLRLAHEVPMAGHLGVTKTKDRVLQRYYWPGIFKDVAQYCRTCEVCQRSTPRKPPRAEMVPMPLVTRPFERIAMDLVGPLPRSRRGNRFILTIVDYATRYPEAIALPSTEAERIARELIIVFSRVGIPEEILSDQGANFMSTLLQEVYQLLHIKRIRTSPYHPQTDGLVERFNGTLKGMLRKFVDRGRKDWDEYLPYLLFAYREVPQESTGYSPFELLYGRRVRGPLDVLKEAWTGETGSQGLMVTQVVEMRKRLTEMMGMVSSNMEKAQSRQKRLYDRGAHSRKLEAGEQVLVLLPNPHNSLKLE